MRRNNSKKSINNVLNETKDSLCVETPVVLSTCFYEVERARERETQRERGRGGVGKRGKEPGFFPDFSIKIFIVILT